VDATANGQEQAETLLLKIGLPSFWAALFKLKEFGGEFGFLADPRPPQANRHRRQRHDHKSWIL